MESIIRKNRGKNLSTKMIIKLRTYNSEIKGDSNSEVVEEHH